MLPKVADDLSRSGLVPADINARDLDTPEIAALGMKGLNEGYVIPYYDIEGHAVPFYRVRLFGHRAKYLQPKNSQNHIYFPRNFQATAKDPRIKAVIITEGEKKATIASKHGFMCVSLGGVDSWRNRKTVLPEGTLLKSAKGNNLPNNSVQMELPADADDSFDLKDTQYAKGFSSLMGFVHDNELPIIIIFDSESDGKTRYEVQRAAASLGFELRYQGVPYSRIKQAILPALTRPESSNGKDAESEGKVGLDDYLVTLNDKGAALQSLLESVLESTQAFPTHPNTREFVNRRLARKRLSRKEAQQTSMAVLCDLDTHGRRLYAQLEGQAYYFASKNKKLLKVNFNLPNKGLLHETPFGHLLYQKYGLNASDQRVLSWLDIQFNAEEPLEPVTPSRVLTVPGPKEDAVTLQLSDAQYVRVTADSIRIYDNGQNGILFESGHVEPVDTAKLMSEVESQQGRMSEGADEFWWDEVLKTVRLRGDAQVRQSIALLYYLSPWLARWRGTQLPVELIIGESGSGKSSLCELRLNIITGQPDLRNAPTDIKDWHASIASSGGLHVTDNVQLADKNLRARLSDELCRLVTEPHPHVEMRKLYSTADLVKLPVTTTFGLTAIQQPFINADILQRAFLIELDKSKFGDEILFDNTWVAEQLKSYGGREAWLAHHLVVLQRFFQVVHKEWNPRYKATHRLINVEQSLILLGKVFGIDTSWIPNFLSNREAHLLSEADWTMEGLQAFVETVHRLKKTHVQFGAKEISDWAADQEDFMDCAQLTNPRRLGRHIKLHSSLIRQMVGLEECGTRANRTMYKVVTTSTQKNDGSNQNDR